MEYREKSCAAIHDLSGAGKCSLTIALPVLSACGVETSVLPTAVLSTHTGGFSHVFRRDLTEDMLPMAKSWKQEGFRFSALYSGFLGGPEQIGMVEEIFQMFRQPEGLVLVDPVMGDGGKLYSSCTEETAAGMEQLCALADVITPNVTEACRLLGAPYDLGPHRPEVVEKMLEQLCAIGPKKAVLTGVRSPEGEVGSACRDQETGETSFFLLPEIEGSYHGTGDLFASTLLGGLLNGLKLPAACALATEFTHKAIESTRASGADSRFGPKFEGHLPWLGAKMAENR